MVEPSGLRVFSHSGDTGDLIYSLATFKTMGGGRLRLVNVPGHQRPIVRDPFSPRKVKWLCPFLEAQHYITGVEYGETYEGINVDVFRQHLQYNRSIFDTVADAMGVDRYPQNAPWLRCDDPNPVAPVVIARSSRHHAPNHDFWRRVRQKYKDIVFIGLLQEHETWQSQFGAVRHQPVTNWWELCRVVAGARIFVANQTAPMALALGLCVPKIVQEVCVGAPNCYFDRPGVHYFPEHPLSRRTDRSVLPDL
jgi:hypothetical protein